MESEAVEGAEVEAPLVMHVIYALGTGGLENGLVNILNRMPPERYRHCIVCLTESGDFRDRLKRDDIDVVALNKRPGHDFSMYLRLWRILKELRPAIVHTRNLAALETQVLSLLLPGTGRVHGEHGRDLSDLDGTNQKYLWLRRIYSLFIHRFVCVSKDLEQWLTNRVGVRADKIRQIYNGVDTKLFSNATPSIPDRLGAPSGFFPPGSHTVIGTVGRLAAVKDQRTLLCAVNHIFHERPELRSHLRCIVVGDGELRSDLETLAKKMGLENQVWFAGSTDDVGRFMRLFDVFVLPSLGEGVSNTILEAMGSGTPVVASDVGGNPELVHEGQTGRLFPVGDARRLADILIELEEKPDVRTSMGRQAAERVARDFDWAATVEAYAGVYDSVLRKSRDNSGAGRLN